MAEEAPLIEIQVNDTLYAPYLASWLPDSLSFIAIFPGANRARPSRFVGVRKLATLYEYVVMPICS